MKVRFATTGLPALISRVGIIGAFALVLLASRCSDDGETGSLETTGDLPEEASGQNAGSATEPAVSEPTDPLGDPFVPGDEGMAKDPAGDAAAEGDDSSILDEPTYEPESAPDTTDL